MISINTFNKMSKLSKIIEHEIEDNLSPDNPNTYDKISTGYEFTLKKDPENNNNYIELYPKKH
ncbi:MAG TPA: hypothetical protein PK357_00605 [Candidatus Pacearchaeota archaeon]|nr:hypothetical protein [Candidatus Pacearchaeota archaeon]